MRRAVLVAATTLLAFTVSRPSVLRPRTLTLEDRVRAQLAIERVYYSHQEGASQPFEKAVSVAGVELKVRTALKQSLALEKYWHTPVTAAMLHAESERMARTTLMPERLRELYAALGNDPFLIEETLARSILVDRLVRNFYAFDQRFHGEERRRAETVREMVRRYGPETAVDGADRFEMELSRADGPNSSPEGQARSLEEVTQKGHRDAIDGVHRLALPPEEFEQARTQAPASIAEVGPLTEEREAFNIQILLESAADRIKVATYRVPKKPIDFWWREARDNLREYEVGAVAAAGQALPEIRGAPAASGQSTTGAAVPVASCVPDNTWLPVPGNNSPGSRKDASVVWTGSLMIVWGGMAGYILNTGSSYDPATDTWTQLSTLNAPRPRYQHSAIWTGSRMIVWGGADEGNTPAYDGGIYDPLNDQWSPMSSYGAGPGRRQHTAVWTGSVMVVWGGWGIHVETDGFAKRYDPSSDSWSLIWGTTSEPTPRYLHSAVWTGTEMVVWGGLETSTGNAVKTGGRYNPVTDTWIATRTNQGAPSARMSHSAVWTGSRMLIWGGSTASGATDSGAKYDPVGNTWESLTSTGAPVARYGHSAVWAGGRMIVWGGTDGTSYFSSGGSYDPVGDAWSALSGINAPPARQDALTVWTGSQMVNWGGIDGAGHGLVTGGRYDPASDSWTPLSIHDAPESGGGRTAIWTGSLMVIWGGFDASVGFPLDTGGRYDPATNVWSDASTIGAPAPRANHTAVWTGTRMVVWGGSSNTSDGGRYEPILDSWSPTSTLNAPSPRTGHVAVWSGSEMIVWGGSGISGGRYNPTTDTWVPTSTVGAPAQIQATAVWTGSRIVIWGGKDASGASFTNAGARYNPSTDTWLPTSTTGAPSGRSSHTAVWTGNRMVIFGGFAGTRPCGLNLSCAGLADGGRYDPVADSWQPVMVNFEIYNHSAVWAGPGSGMIIWGGRRIINSFEVFSSSGSRYNPAMNTWSQISQSGAPQPRAFHSAVWTGNFMIVWGGSSNTAFTDGGRYAFGQGVDDDGDGFSECGGDCNDANSSSFPGAPEICDGLDNDCDGNILENADSDGDGSTICGGDCNDANPLIHPGAAESCNGVDENCNGLLDESFPDADADGSASCVDCNDQAPAVHPGAIETCDGLDNNCNEAIDETFVDADGDGYASCVDCSDSNAAVHPTAAEVCNGIDDNCATGIDEGFPDVDGDGYASCIDCSDSNGSIHPGAPEVCNNLDDDCNSFIDDGLDLDGDGHSSCFGGDCDDQEPGVWSAPSEVQNLHLQAGAPTQLDWSDMSSSVGPLTFYDVYTGSLSVSPGINFSSAICLSLGQMETSFTDFQASPSTGSGYWYLLRALNPCGIGTFGAGSDGQERIIPDCP